MHSEPDTLRDAAIARLRVEAQLRLATDALRQISRHTVKGGQSIAASVAKGALRAVETIDHA